MGSMKRKLRRAPVGWMEKAPEGEVPTNKRDLLGECNTRGMPPRDFMSILCVRCRNHGCVNAGWADSKWEARMLTQEDRLLDNPSFADPKDPRFQPVREVDFPILLREALRLESKKDDWEPDAKIETLLGRETLESVHLVPATPSQSTDKASQQVDEATRALSEASGKIVQKPPVPSPSPSPIQAAPPVALSQVNKFNTEFPEEGVMLDGSPVPVPQPVKPVPRPSEDPWTPKPKERIVAPGARIKMGG